MAENQYQNASEFQLKKCVISKGDGSQPTSLLSGDMIIAFSFHESVFHPFVGASLMLSDSTGFLTDFPIQGGEVVDIEVSTTFDEQTNDGQPIKYKLKVAKIVETHRHSIKAILEEGMEHELHALSLYKKLLSCVEDASVYLEEYARSMIREEEQHSLELKAMLKDYG